MCTCLIMYCWCLPCTRRVVWTCAFPTTIFVCVFSEHSKPVVMHKTSQFFIRIATSPKNSCAVFASGLGVVCVFSLRPIFFVRVCSVFCYEAGPGKLLPPKLLFIFQVYCLPHLVSKVFYTIILLFQFVSRSLNTKAVTYLPNPPAQQAHIIRHVGPQSSDQECWHERGDATGCRRFCHTSHGEVQHRKGLFVHELYVCLCVGCVDLWGVAGGLFAGLGVVSQGKQGGYFVCIRNVRNYF